MAKSVDTDEMAHQIYNVCKRLCLVYQTPDDDDDDTGSKG